MEIILRPSLAASGRSSKRLLHLLYVPYIPPCTSPLAACCPRVKLHWFIPSLIIGPSLLWLSGINLLCIAMYSNLCFPVYRRGISPEPDTLEIYPTKKGPQNHIIANLLRSRAHSVPNCGQIDLGTPENGLSDWPSLGSGNQKRRFGYFGPKFRTPRPFVTHMRTLYCTRMVYPITSRQPLPLLRIARGEDIMVSPAY